MEFDYSRLKGQLTDQQLEEVFEYMSQNRDNIITLIKESDHYLIPLPTHAIFKDKNDFLSKNTKLLVLQKMMMVKFI